MDEIGGDPGAAFPGDGLQGLFDITDRLLGKIGQRIGWLGKLRYEGMLTAKGLFLGLIGLFLLLLLPPAVGWLLRRCGRIEANFRGDRIVQSYGLVILLWAGSLFALTGYVFAARRSEALQWLILTVGFGALGLIDDTWGDKKIKGLRGHFAALLYERKVTTGFMKAVGGAGLAFYIAYCVYPESGGRTLLAAALITLGANAVNLLDLRPGRAGAAFLLAAVALSFNFVYQGSAGAPPLLIIVIPTLIVWNRDAQAKVMLGDVGSNLLGASLGMATAARFVPFTFQIFALLILIALHLLAEKLSLSALIENNRFLNRLDRFTGVR